MSYWTPYKVIVVSICPVVMLANLPVLVTSGLLLRGGAEPKPTYMLLGNVALADLITSVFVILGAVYPENQFSLLICSLDLGMIVACALCSMLSVSLIAVERYVYIVEGIRYERYMSTAKTKVLIACTWAIGLLFGLLPSLMWSRYDDYDPAHCWFVDAFHPAVLQVLCALTSLAIFLVLALYSLIFLTARRAARQTGGKLHSMKTRSFTVVILSFSAFALTWCPYLLGVVWFTWSCSNLEDTAVCRAVRYSVQVPLPSLCFINSLLNPLIYAWWHKPFNRAVRALFCPTRARERRRLSAVGPSPHGSLHSHI